MNKDVGNYAYLYDGMQEIAAGLKDLCLTIDTLCLGLSQEHAEYQSIAALCTVRHCVKTHWSVAHETLETVQEKKAHYEKE